MRKSPLRALFCLITSLGLDSDRVLDPEGASLLSKFPDSKLAAHSLLQEADSGDLDARLT